MDNLFQKSETQKNIVVSDGAWDRVSDLLEHDKRKVKWIRWRIVSVAASLAVLTSITVLVLFQRITTSVYHLEDLDVTEVDHLYSTEDIAMLNQSFKKMKQ